MSTPSQQTSFDGIFQEFLGTVGAFTNALQELASVPKEVGDQLREWSNSIKPAPMTRRYSAETNRIHAFTQREMMKAKKAIIQKIVLHQLFDEDDKPVPSQAFAAFNISQTFASSSKCLIRPPSQAHSPTSRAVAEEIVHGIVSARRLRAHGPLDDLLADGKGLPPLDKHIRDTWDELEALAKEADPNGTERNGLANRESR
jgi:hypothetical protein